MKRKVNRLIFIISILFGFTDCMGVSHLAHSTEGQNNLRIYMGGGIMMLGMMTLMILRFM